MLSSALVSSYQTSVAEWNQALSDPPPPPAAPATGRRRARAAAPKPGMLKEPALRDHAAVATFEMSSDTQFALPERTPPCSDEWLADEGCVQVKRRKTRAAGGFPLAVSDLFDTNIDDLDNLPDTFNGPIFSSPRLDDEDDTLSDVAVQVQHSYNRAEAERSIRMYEVMYGNAEREPEPHNNDAAVVSVRRPPSAATGAALVQQLQAAHLRLSGDRHAAPRATDLAADLGLGVAELSERLLNYMLAPPTPPAERECACQDGEPVGAECSVCGAACCAQCANQLGMCAECVDFVRDKSLLDADGNVDEQAALAEAQRQKAQYELVASQLSTVAQEAVADLRAVVEQRDRARAALACVSRSLHRLQNPHLDRVAEGVDSRVSRDSFVCPVQGCDRDHRRPYLRFKHYRRHLIASHTDQAPALLGEEIAPETVESIRASMIGRRGHGAQAGEAPQPPANASTTSDAATTVQEPAVLTILVNRAQQTVEQDDGHAIAVMMDLFGKHAPSAVDTSDEQVHLDLEKVTAQQAAMILMEWNA